MKYLIVLISLVVLSGEAAEEVLFIGEPIESHIYVRPISVERLTELGVPSPAITFSEIENSNACGLEITVFKVVELLAGNPKGNIAAYSLVGEWCETNNEMGEAKIFHLRTSDSLSHVLGYQFIYDQKYGLVIPGPGHSGMGFLGVSFKNALKTLSKPVYAGTEEQYKHWREAVLHGEIVFNEGNAYFTTGVSVREILSTKLSNK